MPQPLSRVKPKAEIQVGPQALTLMPQFLPQIMGVISRMAHLDGDLGNIFSGLLKTDIETGTAVYQAFQGLEARRIALFAAASKACPEWQCIALQAVWNSTKPARGQRDKFAHHVWGYSRDLPDTLLLMSPNIVLDVNVSKRQTEPLPYGRGILAPKDFDRSQVYVYRKADFDWAAEEARQASWLVTLLYMVIGPYGNEVGRRQLWNEPRFQQYVQKLVVDKSPEVQAQLSPPGDDPPVKGISEHWDKALNRIP